MLSICIPIYNEVPTHLIEELSNQISHHKLVGEILLLDDASTENIQNDLNKAKVISGVRVHYTRINLGRSGARNRLAELAKHPYLLFIDGDSGLKNKMYLKNYLEHAKPNTVCCGGTIYDSEKPQKPHILRWKYGHHRESKTAETRNKNPYYAFTTHHFLIDKKTFLSIKFNTTIQGYGHEDSMFGLALKKDSIPIIHIDNPLLHLGIEPASIFLNKSEEAVRNLKCLYAQYKSEPDFIKSNKLIQFYEKQHQFQLILLWKLLYVCIKPLIKIQLKSNNPSLKLFDFYKFGIFITHKA